MLAVLSPIVAGAQTGPWGEPAQIVPPVMTSQPLSGVTMELPFMEGSGTVAHDISGQGNDATFCTTGSAPVWQPEGGVTLATVNNSEYSCFDTPLQTWGSLFVLACPYAGALPSSYLDPGAKQYVQNGLWGATTGTDGMLFTGDPWGTAIYGMALTLQYPPQHTFAGPTYSTRVNGGCHVFTATLGDPVTLGYDHLYVDGDEQPYAAQAADAPFAATVGHYQIGCVIGCSGGNNNFQGELEYVVASEEPYDAAEVASESSYIWEHVASRGVAQFPYGSGTGNTILAIGDSLTSGYLGTSPNWPFLMQTNNSYAILDLGLNGILAGDIAAMWPERENSYLSTAAERQYCHIWSGTNDASRGFAAETIWAALVQQGRECTAAGGIPIVATMISRKGLDGQKNALNALIRAGWQEEGFAAIDDLAANPDIGADGAWADSTYFQSDGVHLTGPNGLCDQSSGYAIVCNAASAVINALDANGERLPRRPRLFSPWR
jgi:lysophospholipase L1-like esterase